MPLVIACEFLTGVCVAADHADRDRPEWPPHPARLYSALLSAWADAGEPEEERAALDLLEQLGPPELEVPPAGRRDAVSHYVPPNDVSAGRPGARLPASPKAIREAVAVVPMLRRRQPRSFPATPLPHDASTVRFVWPAADVDADVVAALASLTSRVACLGHSSSLVRVAVEQAWEPSGELAHWRPGASGARALRVMGPGRRDELQRRFASGLRPNVGPTHPYEILDSTAHLIPGSSFSDEWYVLRSAGGLAPALEAWPYVAWLLRRALIGLVDRAVGSRLDQEERLEVLAILSGHAPSGAALERPHAAFVPMANVGWARHSTGALMGAAIVLPTGVDRDLMLDCLAAAITFGAVERADADVPDRRVLALTLGSLGEWWLSPALDDPRQSLSPRRYLGTATTWTSATPVVLDRFPKRDGDVEAIVASACAHVGLPAPVGIMTHKHAGVAGAPAARPRQGRADGPGAWRLRWTDETGARIDRFSGRPLTHLTVTFAQPVRGPILLGAGRYHGLGLLLPGEVDA